MCHIRYFLFALSLTGLACSGGKQTAAPPAAGSSESMPEIAVSGADSAAAETSGVIVDSTEWHMADELPFNSSILRDTLDNGIVIYVAHNERPEVRAELRLVVNAGSVLEDDDQLGLAHFVEHMAFNGTENFEKQEIVNYLESRGMRFGPDLNAYTSFDETVYMLQVPTDSMDVFRTGIEILREWASRVAFEEEEVDKERGVVVEEWRLRRGASARMLDKQLPILLKGSRYADRLPIGDPEIIKNSDYATITSFYRDWYRPELMAVVAVGDFDVEEIAGLLREAFSDLDPQASAPERVSFEVPGHEETLIAPASDPEAAYGRVTVVYKRDDEPSGKVEDYRRNLTASLYHGMFNNRLGELRQNVDPPFAFAFSGDGSFARTAEFYNLGAIVREGGVERALKTLLTEAERVHRHGFTESELAREKQSILRAYEKAYDERDKSESRQYASEYIRNYLVDEPVPGIEFEYPLVEALLPTISVADVNALSRKFITDESRVVMLSAPDKAEYGLPDSATVIALFGSVAASEPEPFVDRTLEEPLVSELSPAGSIVKETTSDTLGMTWLTLSNGVRVILKPTDFKNDEILMRGYSVGGTSLYPDSLYIPASTAATVIGQSGVGEFGPIELDKALSGKVAYVHPGIGETAETVGGSASPKDLETLFQLLYLHFTAPRADSVAFESYRVRMKEIIETARSSPERAFHDTVTVTMAQYHYRARPPSAETIEEMDLEASLRIYEDRFEDASDFTFYLVGAFENEEIKPLIQQYLATLPTTEREETWKDVGMRPPKGVVEKTIVKGIEPKSRVLFIFTGPLDFEHENRMRFQTFADVLRIKLREVLREDLGGTYGVRVGASTSRIPQETYRLNISWGCDPERVDELVGQFMVQVDSLKEFGIGEPYLGKARELRRRDHEEKLKRNTYWLESIAFVDRHDEDPMTIIEGYEEFMTRLDRQMMKNAANEFLNTGNYAKFVLLPESYGAQKTASEDGAESESSPQ